MASSAFSVSAAVSRPSPFIMAAETVISPVKTGAAAAVGASAKRRIYASLSRSSPESTRKEAMASMIAFWFGFTMGRSSPAYMAWVRKLTVTFSLAGRPKEILLTPSTV